MIFQYPHFHRTSQVHRPVPSSPGALAAPQRRSVLEARCYSATPRASDAKGAGGAALVDFLKQNGGFNKQK